MKGRRLLHIFLTGFVVLLISGCDKLDDSGNAIAGVLPGTWLFSYELQSEQDTGLAFEYETVVFRPDATCTITYPDGQMDGTYRASGSVIRIDGSINGEARSMLWRILSFSPKQVVAEYEFEWGDQSIMAVVTLDRDTDAHQ